MTLLLLAAALAPVHVIVDQLDNRFREVRMPLPAGVHRVLLERSGQVPTFLDLVAVERGGERLALPGLPEALRVRDLSVSELRDALAVDLPSPAQAGDVLVLGGRQERNAPHGVPFMLPGPQRAALTYRPGSRQGRLRIDGHLDANLGAPVLKVATQPGTGHPNGWATAWVRDDGRHLYAALDFGSDDTDDHGDDYAELWVSGKPYRVTVEQHRYGAVSMERTAAAHYLHKVYEFRVPLPSRKPLQLAFAAYGTAGPAAKLSTCIASDGLTFGYQNRPAGNGNGQVYVYSYDAGWWPEATFDPGQPIGAAYPDPACLTWLVTDNTGVFMVRAASDGGFDTQSELTSVPGYPGISVVAADGGRFAFARQSGDSGVWTFGPDGGAVQELSIDDMDTRPLLNADGDLLVVTNAQPLAGPEYDEATRDGGVWTGPDASTASVQPSLSNSTRLEDLQANGQWFGACPSSDTLHLYQRTGTTWTQNTFAPDEFCSTIAVGENGEVAFSNGSYLTVGSPPSYDELDAGHIIGITALHTSGDAGHLMLEQGGAIALLSVRDLTVVPGLSLAAQTAAVAAPGNPLLSIALRGEPIDTVVLDSLTLQLTGSMAQSATLVHLYEDVDQSGTVTTGDVELGTAAAPDSGGVVAFTNIAVNVTGSADVFLLATVEVPATATGAVTVSTTPSVAAAHLASVDYHFVPSGQPFSGPALTVTPVVVDAGTPDAGEVDAGVDSGVPDAGTPDAGEDAGASDAGPPKKTASGCGCTTGSVDSWLWLIAVAGAWRARRRSA